MGVPQPPESIKGRDVKRYHIHFPPFNTHRGNTEQQIDCGRQRTCLSYFPSLEKGSRGHVFKCHNDKFVWRSLVFQSECFYFQENVCPIQQYTKRQRMRSMNG